MDFKIVFYLKIIIKKKARNSFFSVLFQIRYEMVGIKDKLKIEIIEHNNQVRKLDDRLNNKLFSIFSFLKY